MNWTTIGHKKIKTYLENCLASGRLAHAYLFYGKKGLGKYKLARDFARAIFCFASNDDKVGQAFDKNIHPDFIEIARETDAQNISIKQIRGLNKEVSSSSLQGGYRVIVIRNIENISLAGANALLKTLEEPRKKTVFILLADKLTNIPETIISRAEKIKFLPVGQVEMTEDLTRNGVVDKNLADIVSLSQGKPEKVDYFLKNEKAWAIYTNSVNFFLKVVASKKFARIKIAEDLINKAKKSANGEREYLLSIVVFWETLWHDLLLLKVSISDTILNKRVEKQLISLAHYFEQERLQNIIKEIGLLKEKINSNQNSKIVLENFLFKI